VVTRPELGNSATLLSAVLREFVGDLPLIEIHHEPLSGRSIEPLLRYESCAATVYRQCCLPVGAKSFTADQFLGLTVRCFPHAGQLYDDVLENDKESDTETRGQDVFSRRERDCH
jgi:hypothetical protein